MRALVSMFAGLLIIISLYQLSFTWFVNKHESAMTQKAQRYIRNNYPAAEKKYPGNKEEQVLYKDTPGPICSVHVPRNYWTAPKTPRSPGGELLTRNRKKMNCCWVLICREVLTLPSILNWKDLLRDLPIIPGMQTLLKTIQLADQKKLTSGGANFIDLFAQAFKEVNPSGKLAPLFANTNRNKLKYESSDAEVIRYLHDQASDGMKQTFQVLRNRIDKFGVAQPSINLDENKGIITVELAGATDPDRIRKYLQSTANLQFWAVYNIGELSTDFQNADKDITEIPEWRQGFSLACQNRFHSRQHRQRDESEPAAHYAFSYSLLRMQKGKCVIRLPLALP